MRYLYQTLGSAKGLNRGRAEKAHKQVCDDMSLSYNRVCHLVDISSNFT